jgi:hypothetical protein
MEETELRPRPGVPLKHKVFAFLIAVAVAGALCGWQYRQGTAGTSTAVMAFDADAARQIDPGLAGAREPAVALADSILSDQAIATLAKQAQLSSSTDQGRIGEFRSGLELSQPSAKVLRVRYRGGSPGQAAAHANAVAEALAAWTPDGAGAPAPAAHPETGPPAAAVHKSGGTGEGQSHPASAPAATAPAAAGDAAGRVASRRDAATSAGAPDQAAPHPIADSVYELGAQLVAANRDLNAVGRGANRAHSQSWYIESEQQQLLKTQVRTAERKLEEIRAQAARAGGNDSAIRARLGEIQQALGSVFQRAGGGYGFNGAGTSVRQLGRERAQLNHAISVVNEQRVAIERIESMQTAAQPREAAAGTPPAPAASEAGGGAAATGAQAPSSLTEQNLPAGGGHGASNHEAGGPAAQTAHQPAADSGEQAGALGGGQQTGQEPSRSPLSVVSLAQAGAGGIALSPGIVRGILTGVLCGLFYLGIAWLIYRVSGSHESYAEDSALPQRFITPSGPVNAPSATVRPAEWSSSRSPVREPPIESVPAPEPAPGETAPRRRAAFAFESVPVEGPASRSTDAGRNSEAAVSGGAVEEAGPEEVAAESGEEGPDPLTDKMRKSISDTPIGRMFEGADEKAAS